MLTNGTVLQSRYCITQQVGGGGMGVVYLAEDARLPGHYCAIKEMSPGNLPVQERNWAIGAFRQEAQMLANLNHPGLVRVTDHFAEGGNWYLVMDFVQGQTLEAWLQQMPMGLPMNVVLNYVAQLCNVLEYLHTQNPPVVFRDLKPGNVMVSITGEIKLIDFGIARFFKPGQTHNTTNLGTPGYASPEHGGIGQTDPRSDIYSLGVLLHQLLTGHDPGTTPFNLPPARRLNANIPSTLEDVIKRATQLQPDQRFQSVAEFRQALFAPTQPMPGATGAPFQQPARTPTVVVTPQPQPAGMPKWIWVVAGVIVLVLVVVIATSANKPVASPTPSSGGSPSTPRPAPTDTPERVTPREPTSAPPVEPTMPLPEQPTAPPPTDVPPTSAPQPLAVTVNDTSLGRSVGGRSISMLEVGYPDGAAVVIVGSIEGDQSDTSYAVQQLADYYRSRSDQVPSNGMLYLISSINPDGNASDSRYNGNEVDLNRNWGSGNWVSDAVVPGYPKGKPGSGGGYPFSEPETQALRDLLNRLRSSGRRVYLVTLHSTVNDSQRDQVFPGYTSSGIDEASRIVTQRVGDVLGYRYNTAWSYDTTGEAIAWGAEQSIPSVDIVSKKSNGPSQSQMIRVIEEILR